MWSSRPTHVAIFKHVAHGTAHAHTVQQQQVTRSSDTEADVCPFLLVTDQVSNVVLTEMSPRTDKGRQVC